jgi:hypothetical protein
VIDKKVKYWVKRPGYWFEGRVTDYNPPYGYVVKGFDNGGFPISFTLKASEFEVVEDY